MTFHIITGNCLEVMRKLDAESVHCVVSSPPYWGLRDYGIPPTVWGGDADCEHAFTDETIEGELRRGLGLEELSKRYRGGGKKALRRRVDQSHARRLHALWRVARKLRARAHA